MDKPILIDVLPGNISELISILEGTEWYEKSFHREAYNKYIKEYIEIFCTDTYFVLEYPYIDKVYRDSYYNYYGKKVNSYNRECIRVLLFAEEVMEDEFIIDVDKAQSKDMFRGFFVIRPTISQPIGRSMIHPSVLRMPEFVSCKVDFSVSLLGIELKSACFPHNRQNFEYYRCAESALWSIMEYFGSKYSEYKPILPSTIHSILRHQGFERQQPSEGLTYENISFVLKKVGLGSKVYDTKAVPSGLNMKNILADYVESGVPVICDVMCSDDDDKHMSHGVVVIGRTEMKSATDFDKNADWKENERKKDIVGGVKIIDHSYLLDKLVLVDDEEHYPYSISSFESPFNYENSVESDSKRANGNPWEIHYAIVPLYVKVYMDNVMARKVLDVVIGQSELFSYYRTLIRPKEALVRRICLTSSRSFKKNLLENSSLEEDVKGYLLGLAMPKLFWLGEFSSVRDFDQKLVETLVLLDATEAHATTPETVIAAVFPNKLYLAPGTPQRFEENRDFQLFNRYESNLRP